MNTAEHSLVAVAKLGRAYGLRGELHAQLFNPASMLFDAPCTLIVELNGQQSELLLLRARKVRQGHVVCLKGVESRDAAEALQGAMVYVPRSQFPSLAQDEYYFVDMIDALVCDEQGEQMGRVVDVLDYPSVTCLGVLTLEQVSVEIPFLERYVIDVDIQNKRIVVAHMDELLSND